MQRISSRLTFFHKRVVPVLSFLCLALVLITILRSGPDLFSVLFFAIFVFGGYAYMKYLGLFDLVDEVLDAGDALIVRNGDREERVPLADIIDVSYKQPTFGRPQLGHQHPVTLRLQRPSQFGDEITFWPRPGAASAVIEDLIRRTEAAREKVSDAR